MAAGEAPPQTVFAHGYLLVGGEKMSKTRLNQIAPADLIADFGVDGFRYHFLVDQRFGPDGDFSYEAMVARYNADLANNFGNLANRVLNMAVNYCDGVVPDARADGPLVEAAASAFGALTARLEELDYSSGFGAVWDLIRATNAYIEERAPWALNKAGDTTAVAEVLGDCLESLRVVALLASPLIPRAAGELWRRLGLPGTPEEQRLPEAAAWGGLPPGSVLDKGSPLFPRIESAT
jgi:methionyl-tRNA synthetase